jgi:hypothetical protein
MLSTEMYDSDIDAEGAQLATSVQRGWENVDTEDRHT